MAEYHSKPPNGLSFDVEDGLSHENGQRLGKLRFRGRAAISTPHYVAQVIVKLPNQVPAIYQIPIAEDESRLRRFVALQKDSLLILGPRRHPPVPARTANSNTSIAIQTALGFSTLESHDYVQAIQKLGPDIILGLADYEYLKTPGAKRLEKMGDRTLVWMQTITAGLESDAKKSPPTALFAPVLPIDAGQQSYYLDTLESELAVHISGWTLYDAASTDAIPASMRHLPRLALTDMHGPHDILNQILLGIDLFVPSFVGDATDSGLALTYSFPSPECLQTSQRLELGINLWSTDYVSDLSPVVEECECYTCKNHHRAYVRHLLNAKEMLAWVLLQIHNYHIMDVFFIGVRQSIANGTLEDDCNSFDKSYRRRLPSSTGEGPRLRGYQVKSGRAEPRRNPQSYRSLDDSSERLADAPLPSPSANAEDIEKQGFAEKLV
ncbi:MAG: hypothetical protein Q9201_004620 [Fulgogasparrea decipioides]